MGQFLLSSAVKIGSAFVQAQASRLIGNLFASDQEGPRLTELALQTSTEGAFVPIVYGRMRLAGQVIWTGPVKESRQTRASGGGKGGGPEVTEYSYSISLAVGLCEGPISGIGRVWANGELLAHDAAVMRVHTGADDQAPDPLIEAVEGAGAAPAYRGLAYVVFEDLPLAPFGDRIPSLSFEVLGGSEPAPGEPRLEDLVRGVCLIPASGEFAYATTPVFRELQEGVDAPENVHTARATTDIEAALDDLQALLPRCRSVALVTAWFGDDLRCGSCAIRPGVETRDKTTRPLAWSAAGLDRSTAHLVSQRDDGPVYGGTPSDATIIAAIKALKARGFAVTLYPFILMDVPPGSGRPDPYGAPEQAAFPWRGRISCHPAPGQSGSPDQSAAAASQVEAFFGAAKAADFTVSGDEVRYSGPVSDWGFNRFILHHAALAKAAGGVESFLIGSEMRGLTTVRETRTGYPAVTRLKALAAEARQLLGAGVKLSYAADWSEYFGHAPGDGSGDRLFHLDPLWADPEIDFIGIDWYAPLADWRDGESHADADAGSIHNRDYLRANVCGGEGADWYYSSAADRDAQIRTPITDGAYGEPWVWAYKALPDWWANLHHDRIGGVRQATPTLWIPQAKPIRLVELGCPAVDKGANQPNVFIDPKSAESQTPYYSDGSRDDLIQSRYIEALLDYWAPAHGANPVSTVYGGPMLDVEFSHVWTWDARPFPEFPARTDIWADGGNWRRGHWLSGRVGQSDLGRIATDIARRAGLETLDVSALDGIVAGYVIDRPTRARDLLAGLGAVFGFHIADRSGGAACLPTRPEGPGAPVLAAQLVAQTGEASFARNGLEAAPVNVRLTHVSDDGDYAPASVKARDLDGLSDQTLDLRAPVLADRGLAAGWAQAVLSTARAAAQTAELSLPPSLAALEPGDGVQLDVGPDRLWRIDGVEGVAVRRAGLTGAGAARVQRRGPEPAIMPGPPVSSRPGMRVLDLPLASTDDGPRGGLWVAAWSAPWPGEVALLAGAGPDSAEPRAVIEAPGFFGVLEAPLAPGVEGRWDYASVVQLRLVAGAVSSSAPLAVLGGANRLAVETDAGWEVLGFANAHLQPDGAWRLSGLLRGLGGSPLDGAAAGSAAVVLDGAGAVLPVAEHERGAPLTVLALPRGANRDSAAVRSIEAVYDGRDLRPLSPVHMRVARSGGGLQARWVRRGRIGADSWAGLDIPLDEPRERYQVRLVTAAGAVALEAETEAPHWSVEAALVDSLGNLEGAQLSVRQVSDRYGPGAAATVPLPPV